ncbi:hypothetical protein [Bradyrhizobium sp.]|jgi:hypothetical protein|uniref:hypothetical protein n=1 Tax=Bradyrhizobium sp. TaxID=376 RepID=UPI002E0C65EB|nr:hypothetical protein [Bradyrhizobium sp.]
MNELSVVIKPMRPLLLLSLLLLGALAGLAVQHFFLVKYQARFSLAMSGDLTTFRETEPLFSSPEMFEKYGEKQKIIGSADFEKIHRQFVRNLNSPIRIEHVFRLSRKDTRDLPDVYAKEEVSRQIGSQGLQSDLQVYATAREPETAIRLAKLAMGYARDSLAEISLRLSLRRWGPGARTELATNRETVANLRSDLASADRRIESMERLKDRHKDEKDLAVSPSGLAPSVQFQIAGTRNLSPFQQIIGLETDRAELVEKLRLAEHERLRLETFVRFADLFDSRIGDGASIGLTKEILKQAKQSDVQEDDAANSTENALANIGMQMQRILSRFDESRTNPIEPETRFVGIGRGLATLIGLVVAAAVWLLVVLMFPVPRSKSDVAT